MYCIPCIIYYIYLLFLCTCIFLGSTLSHSHTHTHTRTLIFYFLLISLLTVIRAEQVSPTANIASIRFPDSSDLVNFTTTASIPPATISIPSALIMERSSGSMCI